MTSRICPLAVGSYGKTFDAEALSKDLLCAAITLNNGRHTLTDRLATLSVVVLVRRSTRRGGNNHPIRLRRSSRSTPLTGGRDVVVGVLGSRSPSTIARSSAVVL